AIAEKGAGNIALTTTPAKWLSTKEHSLVKPDTWFSLELIADGPKMTSKINGQVVAAVSDNTAPEGHGFLMLELDARDGPVVVEFRKIEIMELPPSAKLPDTPAQVLPALAGAWKGEFTQRIYDGKPAVKKFTAVAVNDWV